jgi:hypothetical protein
MEEGLHLVLVGRLASVGGNLCEHGTAGRTAKESTEEDGKREEGHLEGRHELTVDQGIGVAADRRRKVRVALQPQPIVRPNIRTNRCSLPVGSIDTAAGEIGGLLHGQRRLCPAVSGDRGLTSRGG